MDKTTHRLLHDINSRLAVIVAAAELKHGFDMISTAAVSIMQHVHELAEHLDKDSQN